MVLGGSVWCDIGACLKRNQLEPARRVVVVAVEPRGSQATLAVSALTRLAFARVPTSRPCGCLGDSSRLPDARKPPARAFLYGSRPNDAFRLWAASTALHRCLRCRGSHLD